MQQRYAKRVITLISFLLIGNAIFLHAYMFRGPLAMAYNPALYSHSKDFSFLDQLIAQAPAGKTVMTQNNLATRFTDRTVYLLRYNYEDYRPEIILMDVREGQNANNFYGLQDPKKLLTLIQKDKNYQQIYSTDGQFAFARIEN
jgi:uncharacterized membrane protein